MRNLLIIAGLGPGSPDLVTIEALNTARNSDLIIIPRSHDSSQGIAERVMLHHFPDFEPRFERILFPMTRDSAARDSKILSQLEKIQDRLASSRQIFFPVIGDSMLYSTGAYLLDSLRKLLPELDYSFIPGISAHSLASCCAKRFLAMSDQILAIIPGTANPEKISATLAACETAAIYKPSALHDIKAIIMKAGFRNIMRVDFAGDPEREKIYEGKSALDNVSNYMSIILLWR